MTPYDFRDQWFALPPSLRERLIAESEGQAPFDRPQFSSDIPDQLTHQSGFEPPSPDNWPPTSGGPPPALQTDQWSDIPHRSRTAGQADEWQVPDNPWPPGYIDGGPPPPMMGHPSVGGPNMGSSSPMQPMPPPAPMPPYWPAPMMDPRLRRLADVLGAFGQITPPMGGV